MANIDNPRGFIPKTPQSGGMQPVNYYDVSASNTAIGVNDLLERRSDGFVWQAQVGSTTIVGVAAQALDANTGGQIAVTDIRDLVMVAQVDDATVNAQTDLDLNYDIVVGAPVNGRSIMEIDGSSQAATATLPIKILRVADVQSQEGNELGAFVAVECVINQSIFNAGNLG